MDTPLSESRFENIFQGWVDEHRVEDDHHDETHFLDDHDHGDDHENVYGEPFPEEKDTSGDDTTEDEQQLNAEINANIDDENSNNDEVKMIFF